ncbi:ATP-dependent DNA helicase RecG [hydrothermal vent metagenome]|uniref:ATP-dependent DNA helicase RecG n=1 Tax=hydrothermal vent metagenome TaxID=652676 RepID=A0A1W1BZI6_9ZZZZ
MNLTDSIKKLIGVGSKIEIALNQLGIYTLEHLLFNLPFRYQNKTKITHLDTNSIGEALIEVDITKVESVFYRKKIFIIHAQDKTGHNIIIRFFNLFENQQQQLSRGETIQCFGEIKVGKLGLEMHHPEYRIISQAQKPLFEKTLTPIYHITQGIFQNQYRKWVNIALEILHKNPLDDFVNYSNININQAINFLHHPPPNADLQQIKNFSHPTQETLILNEFCAHRLSLLLLKKQRSLDKSISFEKKNQYSTTLLKNLNFELTNAQLRVIGEIANDLSKTKPMLRLLQGDVGSGKTIVAVFSTLQVVAKNYQVVIMAPTQILAEQHFINFSQQLEPLNINISYLSGTQKIVEKKQNMSDIQSGKSQIIIGTHALFQKDVEFNNLGLVIIDEQHRFGVHQRLLLTQKAKQIPHQLVMTATPIPRSLAMTAYADLDISVIDELPKNRQKVQTVILNLDKKNELIGRIQKVCKTEQQVYWVSTLIDDSEVLELESAQRTFETIKNQLPNEKIGLLHGRMNRDEKTKIMQDFKDKKINILIATTVIEVGVDVPNATLMIIENSERLGLAQLHQLRGRVGRGNQKSVCVLLYKAPLSHHAKERLSILRKSNDGFLIAQKDLEIRGAGEVLGTQQTGLQQMKIANLNRDKHLLEKTQILGEKLLKLTSAQQQQFINRWTNDHNKIFAGA